MAMGVVSVSWGWGDGARGPMGQVCSDVFEGGMEGELEMCVLCEFVFFLEGEAAAIRMGLEVEGWRWVVVRWLFLLSFCDWVACGTLGLRLWSVRFG